MPTSNIAYWEAKIGRNVTRDKDVRSRLEQAGWESRIIWECELSEGTDSLVDELNGIVTIATIGACNMAGLSNATQGTHDSQRHKTWNERH